MKKVILSSLLVTGLSAGQAFAQTAENLKIITKVSIKGDGNWDLLTVDEENQNLYLSHGMEVNVVNIKTRELKATINDTKGVHGIAIASELNKGFTSNGRDSSVTVFDTKTFKVIERVKTEGVNPDAIIYDEFTKKVFVFNGRSNDATVIDAKSNKVIGTIKLDGKPELCTNDDKGTIYVNIEDKSTITVIDAVSLKVKNNWPIAPGEEPTGLALDQETNRLFSVCGNKLMIVIDALTGKVVTNLPIGDGCDGVVFDAGKKCVYASNGADGTITAIKEEDKNTFKVIQTLETQKGAKTIALCKKNHQLFLPTAEFGERPPVTKENPRPRKPIVPNTFCVIVVE